MPRNSCVVSALLSIVLFSPFCLAQAPPSADAYVTNLHPAANFGNSALLPVQDGTTSYLRLNLGGFPASANVSKATLRLYVNAVVAPGSFDVYQIGRGWTERGLTSSNAPPWEVSATGGHPVSVTTASLNQFLLIDITGLVQSWLRGETPNYGIALALSSVSGSFSFDSKEGTHQPELDVILADQIGTGPAYITATLPSLDMKKAAGQQTSDPYIDNGTALQVGGNFNIDGNGSSATFNATSQYLLGGIPVLGTSGSQSLFVGTQAGQINTGDQNTFVGIAAGQNNSTGSYNAFIGATAGYTNTSGTSNLFVGTGAGGLNTTGSYNTFIGTWAGLNNTTGSLNNFVGTGAGSGTTTGQYNTMFGTNAGLYNTAGSSNSFFGGASGLANTTGSNNVFFGVGSGSANTTGSNNVYVGVNSGLNADPAANNNLYFGSRGVPGESGTTRIGDPSNQTGAYLAGVNGAVTNGGAPVFIDSTGKLGTSGGAVSFTQVTGTLGSPQFTGTYSNSVTLSNTNNIIEGTFTGNGSGLTGVSSGLSWPIIIKFADYQVQSSDFSTATKRGNFLILTGAVTHTFNLPNPAPPNGSCVAIGNLADAGINSNANAYLRVTASPLTVDSDGTFVPTQPRRTSYLYCSDGSNYYRLGYAQNGVSEVGPWLKTLDTGTVNLLQTTFRNGMDFGLAQGSMIYLLPKFANTSGIPTLNVNGLGAYKILRFGNQALAPGDLSTTAFAQLIFDGLYWELLNPQTINGTVTSVTAAAPLVSSGGANPILACPTCVTSPLLTGTTGMIGGTSLSAGSCTTGTAAVAGATVGHPVFVSASDGSLPNGLVVLSAAVTNSNSVTVQLCATASVTPMPNTYNVATQ